jgi:transketolase
MKSAQDLQSIANQLRFDVLQMVHNAGAGHVAGPLSSADLMAMLYFGGVARFDVNNPWWEERDRIVLSCGHYCPILYAALARAGFFSTELLSTFGHVDSLLGIHPEHREGERILPGVEVSSGPLGQGVSVAVGMALALKLTYSERPQNKTPRVYCILSDGELQEGQVWEAFNFAVRRQLDNLIFLIDRNKIQIEEYTAQAVIGSSSIVGKLESFGLYTLETNGNDIEKLTTAIDTALHTQGSPVAIVLNTIAGKGVSYMENKPEWHDKVPTMDDLAHARKELSV